MAHFILCIQLICRFKLHAAAFRNIRDSPEKQVEASRREKHICQVVDRLTDVGQQLMRDKSNFCQVPAAPPHRLGEGRCVTVGAETRL